METESATRIADMPTTYDPGATERRWYAEWLRRGLFHAAPSDREPYCIVLPPPNVTGGLHMGHALDHTLQDILIRRARMRGPTSSIPIRHGSSRSAALSAFEKLPVSLWTSR